MIINLYNTIISLYFLRKCDLHLDKKEYRKAYNVINKINKSFAKDLFYRYYLYNGFILFMLEKFDNSITYFNESISIIDKAYEKNMINSDERDYLKEYSYRTILFMFKYLDELYKSKQYLSEIDNLEYDIKNVKKSLFYRFPFVDIKKWDIETERRLNDSK